MKPLTPDPSTRPPATVASTRPALPTRGAGSKKSGRVFLGQWIRALLARSKNISGAEWFFVVGVLLLATWLRLWGVDFGQPDPQYAPTATALNLLPLETPIHPDEVFYISIPLQMAVTKYPNPKFWENSTLMIYLNFATFLITDSGRGVDRALWDEHGLREIAPFNAYVVGRVYSTLGGLLAVAGAYAAARRLGGRFAAAGAGLLTAVSCTLVQ